MRRILATALSVFAVLSVAVAAAPASAAPNMVPNGTLTAGTGNAFDCFQYSGWGRQTHSLSAVVGRDGTGRAAKISVSSYVDGDRKLIVREDTQCGIAVSAGTAYDLSAWYTSTRAVDGAFFRHTAEGWTWWYVPGATFPASSTWREARVTTPLVPTGTDRVAWGLGIAGDGTLVMDDLSQVVTGTTVDPPAPPVPPPPTNLVKNPLLATGSVTPDCFQVGGWGDHTLTAGPSTDIRPGTTGRSWRIDISGYVSGDRKLMIAETGGCPAVVQAGQLYTASVWYKSTVPVSLSFFRQDTTGGWNGYYVPNAIFPAASTWARAEIDLPALPAGTQAMSFGMQLDRNGTLLTHDYFLGRDTSADLPADATPAQVGRWSVSSVAMPLRAMHATLLRDGRVLLIAGSGNDPAQFTAGSFKTSLWNPADNTFTSVPTPVDLFCAGHVTLPDGRVLVQGGTKNYPGMNGAEGYEGLRHSYVFDPSTNAFSRLNDTIDAHWYPTLTKLENGNVWMAGGLNEFASGSLDVEMFDAGANRWLSRAEVPQSASFWGLYPHMFLMGDGRLFYTGAHTFGRNLPGTGASIHDWRKATTADVPGLREKDLRDQAGSVLLPPAQNQKFMIVGGGYSDINARAISLTDIIDLKAASPAYVPGPDLPGIGKSYVNLTTLPNRTVLASNGATNNRSGDIQTAAVFDPRATTWTNVRPDPVGRNYHSVSILLQDGRVAVFGSNPADGSYELRISVYEPPYLFQGTRPTIDAAPIRATYGSVVDLAVSGAVSSASLTSLRSATHQTDTNERLVDLPLTGSGTARKASIPTNAALLPPGPYMLTVLDSTGIPSVAKMITIR